MLILQIALQGVALLELHQVELYACNVLRGAAVSRL
jgi:hypothetical protein